MIEITPQQSKAARALLGVTQNDFADEAGVGWSTISDFESGKRQLIKATMSAIIRGYEQRGLFFTRGGVVFRGHE